MSRPGPDDGFVWGCPSFLSLQPWQGPTYSMDTQCTQLAHSQGLLVPGRCGLDALQFVLVKFQVHRTLMTPMLLPMQFIL